MRVEVRSKSALGRCRAGLRFSRTARVVDVTNEQLREIEADSALIVAPCEDDAPITPDPVANPPVPASVPKTQDDARRTAHKPSPGKGKR